MIKYFIYVLIFFFSLKASAENLPMNTAQMQALDKITGRVSIIEVPVGGEVRFGTFSVVVRSCQKTAEGEVPEDFAFVDVTDKSFDQEEYNIFRGWMMSSSPAINAVEHPIYDVWLLKCHDTEVKKELLLTAEALEQREKLPRKNEVIAFNESLEENTFEEDAVQTISFKDAMYKEEVKPEVQNPTIEKVAGSPQNLLNITDEYESEEEMVHLSDEDFSKALELETQKLNNVEQNPVQNLENDIKTDSSDELQEEIKKELQQIF